MKKIFALLIAILMVATLVACSGKDDIGNPLETLGVNDNSFSNNNIGTFTYEVGEDGHYEITSYNVNVATEHTLDIPSEIDDVLVTAIADEAFKSVNSITSVTIPASVKRIGDFAFSDCDKLTTVTFADSVEELGVGLFQNCDLINNIVIPANVTVLPDYIFWGCASLSNITFNAKLEVIGEGAFYNCDALTAVTLPAALTEVQDAAFYGCDNLATVTVGASVTKIGDAAFSGLTKNVTFKTTEGSYFATYFGAVYGINEKDYSHYAIQLVK